MDDRHQLSSDQTLSSHEVNLVGQTNDRGRNQHLDVAMTHSSVRRGVLSFEIGVDRHLINTASTVFRYPIDGDGAALASYQLDGVIGQLNLHDCLS